MIDITVTVIYFKYVNYMFMIMCRDISDTTVYFDYGDSIIYNIYVFQALADCVRH